MQWDGFPLGLGLVVEEGPTELSLPIIIIPKLLKCLCVRPSMWADEKRMGFNFRLHYKCYETTHDKNSGAMVINFNEGMTCTHMYAVYHVW